MKCYFAERQIHRRAKRSSTELLINKKNTNYYKKIRIVIVWAVQRGWGTFDANRKKQPAPPLTPLWFERLYI